MNPALLLFPAAVLVLVVGLVLFAAVRGADIARALQDRRYARRDRAIARRAQEVATVVNLRAAELQQAQKDHAERSGFKRRQFHDWQREFYAAGQAAEIQSLGIAGVKWNDQGYGVGYINNPPSGYSPGEQTVGVFFGGPTRPQR